MVKFQNIMAGIVVTSSLEVKPDNYFEYLQFCLIVQDFFIAPGIWTDN